jgi:hypothetical protein
MLVYHYCTSSYVFRGRQALLDRLPPHKTLFGAPPGKGLPIGNLNSQFFANVYLNGLDQFVKHRLKCRHYLRYDDFLLLSRECDELLEWQRRIEAYLREERMLELNPPRRMAPVSNGIDFLGYIVRRDHRLVRRRVVDHLRQKLQCFERQLVDSRGDVVIYRFDENRLDALAAMLSSYLGHFRHADAWRLWQAIWRRYTFLSGYFEFDAEHRKLVRKYFMPKGLRRVKRQYRYLRWRFPDDVLFFRVGRFMECYDVGEPDWVRWLGLKRMSWNRRGACYGFPASQTQRHLQRLLGRGRSVLFVKERRSGWAVAPTRIPTWCYAPSA